MRKLIENEVARLKISKTVDELSAKLDNLAALLEKYRGQVEGRLAHIDSGYNPAAALGYQGDDVNKIYRGFVGGVRPLSSSPAPIPFGSAICQQIHFSIDQFRFWIQAIKDRPRYHRKLWEFAYVSQVLHERGMLAPGRRGLGFGVGREPLPALFASFGAEVVASDQSLDGAVRAGWASTHQHTTDLSVLNERGICTDRMFRELVSFAEVDMNAIDPKFNNTFDFCWSACSLEHLGSLEHGLQFIKNSMNVLKPGGIAVHTTEYNLNSNDATLEYPDLSVYRRRDIDRLLEELVALGHSPVPIDYNIGDGFAETVVDLPPYGKGEPHIRLRLGEFDCTSIGVIVQKGR